MFCSSLNLSINTHCDLETKQDYIDLGQHWLRYWLACPRAQSHHLNQCWFICSEIPSHSSKGIIMRKSEDTNHWNKIENCIFKIAYRSPRNQWVETSPHLWREHLDSLWPSSRERGCFYGRILKMFRQFFEPEYRPWGTPPSVPDVLWWAAACIQRGPYWSPFPYYTSPRHADIRAPDSRVQNTPDTQQVIL